MATRTVQEREAWSMPPKAEGMGGSGFQPGQAAWGQKGLGEPPEQAGLHGARVPGHSV